MLMNNSTLAVFEELSAPPAGPRQLLIQAQCASPRPVGESRDADDSLREFRGMRRDVQRGKTAGRVAHQHHRAVIVHPPDRLDQELGDQLGIEGAF